jgi:DNA-directed RNA polymerase I, II, and III subunit RPABC2
MNKDDEQEVSDIESEIDDNEDNTKKKTNGEAVDSDVEPSDQDSDVDASDNDNDEELENEEEGSDIGEEVPDILDQNRPFDNNFSDNEDDDDDEDDHYLQKFDTDTQKKIISEFHPELQAHNYDEVEILSRVIRDENGNIMDSLHKTLPFITKYEKARILGERAKQIDAGALPLVEVDPSIIDGYLIALKEFDAKVIPFIIQRPLPSGACEYWKFSDLEILA